MTWGPVVSQFAPLAGFLAKGSVLLASDPPCSMYMNPTLPCGGFFWAARAIAQAMAFLSRHIGSLPGELELSGMQVNPFLASRTVRIVPADISTIVALAATLPGVADSALLIIALSSARADVGKPTDVAKPAEAEKTGQCDCVKATFPYQ
jgi:hypothetical protein